MKKRYRRRSCGAVMEPLGGRVMLSISLNDGVLSLEGTAGADRLAVRASQFINALAADDNGEVHYYALSAVKTIVMHGGSGNDRLSVDDALSVMNYACSLDGGNGNDKLTARWHSVRVIGGNGNDHIVTGSGNDWINSGKGNDYVAAWVGDDTVTDSGGHDTILGDSGKDVIKALGQASVNGGSGNDILIGSLVYGGTGSDTLDGTGGRDVLHGDGGDDLIRGWGGEDKVYGDGGNDAVFGGSASDTILGGAGNDNLYGDDGNTDKNHADDGHDDGFGQTGSDWFESTHAWHLTDRSGNDRSAQNALAQDPSYGGDPNGVVFTGGPGFPPYVVDGATTSMKKVGDGGWMSEGRWDAVAQRFVAPVLEAGLDALVKPVVMQLPAKWKVVGMSMGENDMVWYQLNSQPVVSWGKKVWVRKVDGTLTRIFGTMAELGKGVVSSSWDDAARTQFYRFVGVKRGTVLVSGGTLESKVEPQVRAMSVTLLALPVKGWARVAGLTDAHALAAEFLHVPVVAAGTRGILVDDGGILLSDTGGSFVAG